MTHFTAHVRTRLLSAAAVLAAALVAPASAVEPQKPYSELTPRPMWAEKVKEERVSSSPLSLLPDEDMAMVQRLVEKTVRAAAPQARLEWVSGISGAEVPLDSPLYRTVSVAIVAITGQSPHVNPLHTASDIRNPILQAGIPTVGLGPLGGNLTQNGLTDEWVDVTDYRHAVAVVVGQLQAVAVVVARMSSRIAEAEVVPSDAQSATAPVTWGVAIDVPDRIP